MASRARHFRAPGPGLPTRASPPRLARRLPRGYRTAANDPYIEVELRFQNQWEDPESGLYYNYQRYYDPDTGQYLSPDPIGLRGGLRPQGYVHNPVGWVDPWGLAGCPPEGNVPDSFGSAGISANASRLNSQLIAEEVARGHAFEKHVVERGEFSSLGIRTREQFQGHIEGIVSDPATPRRYAVDGTSYYLDESTRTIVIRGQRGEATAFRPDYGVGWDNYLELQVPRNTQPPTFDPVQSGRTF
jgi:RHS repeat-associated protein